VRTSGRSLGIMVTVSWAALPYGSFTTRDEPRPRLGVRLDHDRAGTVLDLTAAAGELVPGHAHLFERGSLDPLLAAGARTWAEVRAALLDAWEAVDERWTLPIESAILRLPWSVGDYVDFYASEHHAANLGSLFRPGSDPLTPNWRHLPIGYHGRAGTVVVSGTPVRRPSGQYREGGGEVRFGPSRRLDFEVELGFVIGVGSTLGEPVPLAAFADHVFGVCLVNDWSARDIQAWEYVPLGPFLGKSFATSVSGWVTPLAAVEAARLRPPPRQVPLLPYLDDDDAPPWGLDLTFQVRLNGVPLSTPPFAGIYWTGAQMLAHLTVNGASVRPGDLFASGTVSGPDPGQWGSLIELTRGGTEPITMVDGSRRTFLEDGDEVVITAHAPGPDGARVGLGDVTGRVTS
jgi:fumarylacetoacetase